MTKPSRIYAVLANHNPSSLSSKLFAHATDHLERQGAFVDRLDLYKHHADIPFYFPHKPIEEHGIPALQEFPFFHENKERFMEADYLLIVYPIYWYSTPGILKTWIDLITNFAWQHKGGSRAQALHKIKHALVVQSSFQPLWRRRWLDGDLERRQLSKTFDFIGIKQYTFYDIGSVHKLSPDDIEKHATSLVKQCSKQFLQSK